MTRLAAVVVIAMLMVSCRSGRLAWVDEEPIVAPVVAKCRGGTVNTERRVTDVNVLGRTRSTTYRTDACLD
jgi:hypothetical protein